MRDEIARLELARIEVLDLISRGEVARDALKMCGIPNSTFWLWLTRGRETADENSPYKKFWLKYKVSKESGRRKRQAESEKRKADPQMYENYRTNQYNPRYLDAFTKLAQDTIIEKIRSGAFLDDSFLAAGVEIHHARYWMEMGHRGSIDEVEDEYGFVDFYRRVITAQGEARASVAARLMAESPALWALHGPGRTEGERVGWEKNQRIIATVDKKVQIQTSWRTAQTQIVDGGTPPLQISFRPGGAGDLEQDEG